MDTIWLTCQQCGRQGIWELRTRFCDELDRDRAVPAASQQSKLLQQDSRGRRRLRVTPFEFLHEADHAGGQRTLGLPSRQPSEASRLKGGGLNGDPHELLKNKLDPVKYASCPLLPGRAEDLLDALPAQSPECSKSSHQSRSRPRGEFLKRPGALDVGGPPLKLGTDERMQQEPGVGPVSLRLE